MDFLILNEESLPFLSQEACDLKLPLFLTIIETAFKEQFDTVRVSDQFSKGWYQVELLEGYYLFNWLEKKEKDYERRIKSLIAKTSSPQIPENDHKALRQSELSEFILSGTKRVTPSLGAAVILDKICISFQTDECWNCLTVHLIQRRLQDNGDLKEKECEAKNCSNIVHWKSHFIKIAEERKENSRKGDEFWKNRKKEFPNLIFCKQSQKYFRNLSVSNAILNRLWENLKLLNQHIVNCKSDQMLKKQTSLDFSDESESVKTNGKLRRHRMFLLPDGSREFFGLHIKNFPAAYRIHFLPDYDKNLIFIGYFGKHLPTKKER